MTRVLLSSAGTGKRVCPCHPRDAVSSGGAHGSDPHMHPTTVRRIDAWLGRPLCFGLTLARRAGSLLRTFRADTSKAPRPPRRILILKLIEQGATVLAYRAIERAVQAVGRENVYFLVFARNRAILDLLDLIPPENVLAVRDDG